MELKVTFNSKRELAHFVDSLNDHGFGMMQYELKITSSAQVGLGNDHRVVKYLLKPEPTTVTKIEEEPNKVVSKEAEVGNIIRERAKQKEKPIPDTPLDEKRLPYQLKEEIVQPVIDPVQERVEKRKNEEKDRAAKVLKKLYGTSDPRVLEWMQEENRRQQNLKLALEDEQE